MISHVALGSNDIAASKRFYDAVLSALGYVRQKEAQGEIGYAADGDVRCRFWVVEPFNREPATFGNGVTIALVAPNRAAVDAFHAAALAAGGTDEGAPGLRPFHASFYAAFVRDHDGNKISAVCEKRE